MSHVIAPVEVPRRIAVDLTHLGPGGENGGAALVATSLITEWSRLAANTEFVVLTLDRSHSELAWLDAPNVRRVCARVARVESHPMIRIRNALGRFIPPAAMSRLRAAYRRASHNSFSPAGGHNVDADLIFAPLTTAERFDSAAPVVALVHDLQHVERPEFLTPHERAQRNVQFAEVYRRANHLICVSEHVRDTLLHATHIGPDRVTTIQHTCLRAIASEARPLPSWEHSLLYPANFWPHKNHHGLLTAFRLYLDRYPDSRLKLVCSGAQDRHMDQVRHEANRLGLGHVVTFPGYLPGAAFDQLLASCFAVIYPSLFEGFGMPLLEAMAAEKPVLCSDIEILHEVAGDAALYFDPRRPEDIAAKINDLETTSTLRTNLVERGRTQVRRFGTRRDWALRYLRTFAQVVGSRDPQPRTRRPVHP